MASTTDREQELVERFAYGIAERGLAAAGVRRRALIVGHEIALLGGSQRGNRGSADLLMVTDDGRWWLIEAKLARSAEAQPNFLFGNQLARYASSIEKLGVAKLHPRLESYLYGRPKSAVPT